MPLVATSFKPAPAALLGPKVIRIENVLPGEVDVYTVGHKMEATTYKQFLDKANERAKNRR